MTSPTTPSEPRSFLRALAFFISALTSPYVTVSVTAVLLAYLLHPTRQQVLVWGAIAVLFAAVLPFAVVFLLWRLGDVTDMHVALRQQRAVPFVAALVSVACGMVVLHWLRAPDELLGMGALFLGNGVALTLISLRWKISAHAAALAGGAFALTLLGYPVALWALGLLPPLVWARVYRRRHTVWQVLMPVGLAAVISPLAYHGMLWLLER